MFRRVVDQHHSDKSFFCRLLARARWFDCLTGLGKLQGFQGCSHPVWSTHGDDVYFHRGDHSTSVAAVASSSKQILYRRPREGGQFAFPTFPLFQDGSSFESASTQLID